MARLWSIERHPLGYPMLVPGMKPSYLKNAWLHEHLLNPKLVKTRYLTSENDYYDGILVPSGFVKGDRWSRTSVGITVYEYWPEYSLVDYSGSKYGNKICWFKSKAAVLTIMTHENDRAYFVRYVEGKLVCTTEPPQDEEEEEDEEDDVFPDYEHVVVDPREFRETLYEAAARKVLGLPYKHMIDKVYDVTWEAYMGCKGGRKTVREHHFVNDLYIDREIKSTNPFFVKRKIADLLPPEAWKPVVWEYHQYYNSAGQLVNEDPPEDDAIAVVRARYGYHLAILRSEKEEPLEWDEDRGIYRSSWGYEFGGGETSFDPASGAIELDHEDQEWSLRASGYVDVDVDGG